MVSVCNNCQLKGFKSSQKLCKGNQSFCRWAASLAAALSSFITSTWSRTLDLLCSFFPRLSLLGYRASLCSSSSEVLWQLRPNNFWVVQLRHHFSHLRLACHVKSDVVDVVVVYVVVVVVGPSIAVAKQQQFRNFEFLANFELFISSFSFPVKASFSPVSWIQMS